MKKLLVILSAFALSLSLANAQMGDGPMGPGGDSGPRDGVSGMWAYLTDAINNVEDAELKTDLSNALTSVTAIRETLRSERANYDSIEDFHNAFETEIAELKVGMETLQTWFRENRPDRPDPVMTGDMVRRRLRFKTNSDGITQTQRRLRELKQSDPDNPECDQLRERLGNLLGERKQLLREQRRGEGGPGGEGDGNRRGG